MHAFNDALFKKGTVNKLKSNDFWFVNSPLNFANSFLTAWYQGFVLLIYLNFVIVNESKNSRNTRYFFYKLYRNP